MMFYSHQNHIRIYIAQIATVHSELANKQKICNVHVLLVKSLTRQDVRLLQARGVITLAR